MREITTHHDGHGLNEAIGIHADPRDPFGGGTSNYYLLLRTDIDDEFDNGPAEVAKIQFQHGPRGHEDSKPGITDGALLAIEVDRYEGFQAGDFACPENELILGHLRAALRAMRMRADERARQKVLGQNKQHITFDGVESSNVHSIGYNADTSELHVRFKGKDAPTHYVYAAVPHGTYEALLRADSVGKYFAAFVKNQYECSKVSA